MRAYPLKFREIFRPMVWGGRKLGELLGKNLPPGEKIGESWEVSEYGSNPSVVKNGPYRGKTLRYLLEQFTTQLVGTLAWRSSPGRFPLLIKFLDASEKLSLQVHPDDQYARRQEGGQSGKTEAWYVIAATPGAELICGISQNTSPLRFAQAIRQGSLDGHLQQVAVSSGDVIFIPAGRVHAVGKNICLYEVQQTSDLTYRLWDWGRPRELHLEKGLEAIDFQFVPDPKVEGVEISTGENSRKYLIACRFFAVELLTVRTSLQERCDGRSFHILSVLEGEGKLFSPEGEENVGRGESILLPAATGTYGIRASAPLRVLKSYVPDLRQDIILPLRNLGKSDQQICALGGQGRSNDIAPLLRENSH